MMSQNPEEDGEEPLWGTRVYRMNACESAIPQIRLVVILMCVRTRTIVSTAGLNCNHTAR